MNLNYCPEQVTGRCVLLVCVSPLLIVRLLESRCNDVSFAQKHTSDRYGVGLQTDCTLRETTAVLAPMSSGFEFDARRLTRSRVSVCTWSCLPAVSFDRGSDEVFSVGRGRRRKGEEQVHPPGEVYAWFMLGLCALPTTRPVRTQCQRFAFCVRVPRLIPSTSCHPHSIR